MSKIDPRYKNGQIYSVRCRYDDNLILINVFIMTNQIQKKIRILVGVFKLKIKN